MAMKVLAVLIAVITVGYTTSTVGNAFENIDIEDFKQNPERIDDLVDCLKVDSECTENDAAIKKRASEIESTACKPCSAKEKELLQELLCVILIQRPLSAITFINFFNKSGYIYKILNLETLAKENVNIIKDSGAKQLHTAINKASKFLASNYAADLLASTQDLIAGLRGKRQ